MSPTLTRTVVVPRNLRARSLSLSLVGKRPSVKSHIEELPSELVISILEVALLTTKPEVLATLSKAISALLNHVIYRTIIIRSSHDILNLHNTVLSSPHLLKLVKRLVVTWEPSGAQAAHTAVAGIVAACHNLISLTLPTTSLIPSLDNHHNLQDLTSPSFVLEDGTAERLKSRSATLTHIRSNEPPEWGWLAPCDLLDQLGKPANISHLQLSRRTGANEANDIAFADDVATILTTYPKIRAIVISIFNTHPWASDDLADRTRESHIWTLLEEIRSIDTRVVLREGQVDEWRKELTSFYPGDPVDSQFWRRL